ncbi:MAG: selenium cofactor biosynthesis protein YqeC [Betaproteobacteria bacterium]|nr:selenium cofactor biosynthesis protein YqeC [Betaproteobacteria bacterium]
MLVRALGLEQARLISLCGAGGKTTLMFCLAREFVAAGERVLVTTTTKIARDEAQGRLAFAAISAEQVLSNACQLLPEDGPERAGVVIAYSEANADGCKLNGFAPELVDALAQAGRFDRILVEADGSARRPLKAPAAHEPVIPSATQALIIVAGLSGLGLPLSEDKLFRANIWSRLSGLALGAPVSAESLARCLIHLEGLARGCPAKAQTILFLNQADTPERRAEAKRVAQFLAMAPRNGVGRVVIGCLLPQPNIASIVSFQESVATYESGGRQ